VVSDDPSNTEGAADGGGVSDLTARYEDNPDAPPSSVAQIEVLKDEDEGSR
jgi:hypothetical protein